LIFGTDCKYQELSWIYSRPIIYFANMTPASTSLIIRFSPFLSFFLSFFILASVYKLISGAEVAVVFDHTQ